jgi:hypothetical protein
VTPAGRLDGSATHNGGSCQISLSFDGGSSWQVIKSFIGGCVRPDPGADQEFSFTIPKGTPSGDALFAWLVYSFNLFMISSANCSGHGSTTRETVRCT